MSVDIRPHVGQQRIEDRIVEDCDTGIDAIFLTSREYPTPKRVGFLGRDPGSQIVFTSPISESDHKQVLQAVADRLGQESNASMAEPLVK